MSSALLAGEVAISRTVQSFHSMTKEKSNMPKFYVFLTTSSSTIFAVAEEIKVCGDILTYQEPPDDVDMKMQFYSRSYGSFFKLVEKTNKTVLFVVDKILCHCIIIYDLRGNLYLKEFDDVFEHN